MKKYQANFIQIGFAILSVPVVGLLALSNNAQSISIFICLLSLLLVGYFFRTSFPSPYNSYKRLIFVAGAGLIFYNIVFFVFFPNHSVRILLIFPIFWGLISYYVGILSASREKLLYLIFPFSAVLLIYAFNIYPYYFVKNFNDRDSTKTSLEALTFDALNVYTCDSISIEREAIEAQFILVESWNEYCGNCLSAMRDLHPFSKELERKYDFNHLYLYHQVAHSKFTNPLEACNFKLLPYPNLPVAISQANTPVLYSAPHFLLINASGEIEYLFSGYNSRYKRNYEKMIKNVLEKKVNLLKG